jgi:hypothetical protein
MEEVFMKRKAKLSLVAELAAVILSASLVLAAGAKAAGPSLDNSFQSHKQICPPAKAGPKLASLPRMMSPAQFCPVPGARGTSRTLKSCWESYLRNPENYRNSPQACSATPLPDEDFTSREAPAAIPADMFHFLSAER